MNLKVNITIGGPAYNGFLNLDPLASPNDPSKISTQIEKLDHLIDHNSVELLLALDVLDYMLIQSRGTVLTNYLCKICHGGTCIVGGVDIREAGRAIYYQQLDLLREGNMMLYGNFNPQGALPIMSIKKSLLTVDNTIEIIQQTNQFDIIKKTFDGIKYQVECKRR